ncbi:MAG TPA: sigma-70 family RNA polymerase sigma factor [Candidatus Eisenbacteria bacterium]
MTHEERPEATGPERHLSARELDRFNECVLPYLDAAHNLARYLLRDGHEAEDAVQDAFLRAIRYFDGFRGGDGRAWLLSIVRNTCFTRLRDRSASRENVEFVEEIHTTGEESPGPDVELERKAATQSVREGLDRLAAEFREVLVLRELEGLSYKEIAQVSGVPIGTVMSRLARGRKQLLGALRPKAPEEKG